MLSMVLLIAGFVAIFYFMMIRPQKKQQTQHRKFLDGLKKGDEVVTQSGIFGRIAGITDSVITLEIAEKIKIKVARPSIVGLQADANATESAKPTKAE